MNKKGDVPWYVVSLLLALGVLFVVFFMFKKPSAEAGIFFSTETLKLKDDKCKFDTDRAERGGMKVDKSNDKDEDRRLDACDICVNGPNNIDNDLDGMPSGCDKDDNDRTVIACSRTLEKDGRCI